MKSVASNNTQMVTKNCPVCAGRNKESFQEYKIKLRVCLSLYSEAVFEALQGKAQPSSFTLGSTDTATLNAVAEHKWLQANQDLWSVLVLTTSGSANNAVKKFEGKRTKDRAEHGQLAWKALTDKYNGHTKEARRVCHEKLVNKKMEPGQDPDDLFFVLDECRDLLEEMGRTIHDERYKDIILQALPPKYERVRTASNERRGFGLDGLWDMVHAMYVDSRSLSTLSRWWGTPAIICSAISAKDSDASRRTAPS